MSEGKNPFEGELRINRDEKADLFYSFNHCAVKTAEVQAAEFNSVRFIAYEFAPSYKLTGVYGSPAPFVFDYRPLINKDQDGKAQKDQPVVGQADTIYSRIYPFDRLGVPRLMDKTTSDTGAYEHAEEDENEK